MSGFGQIMREFLFGPTPQDPPDAAKKQWRDAIHEHRNVSQVSVAEARKSKKTSMQAIEVAECAVKILEKTTNKEHNRR